MQNILKTALAVAVAVSGTTEAAGDSGMRFLAKQNPNMQVVIEKLDPDLARNGANQEAIRNQVELAMRRCGFGMDSSGLSSALALVVVNAVAKRRGLLGKPCYRSPIPRLPRVESLPFRT